MIKLDLLTGILKFECFKCAPFQVVMTDTLKETSVSVHDLSDPCDLAAALLTSVPHTSEKSVPNLSGAAAAGGASVGGANHESSAASLLETFAAVARRRAPGTGGAGGVASTNTNNSRNTANSLNTGIFGRGLTTNSVSSLVRLAMSSNFPSGLLNQVY